MKTIKTTILFYLITFGFATAQVDTTDWFPMQTGNYWEFMAMTIEGPKYFSQRVVGDTLMLNGMTYMIISEEYFNPYSQDDWYLRKELDWVLRYYADTTECTESEYVYLDFSMPDSSIWQICRIEAGGARGIRETFYDYTYYDFLNKPNEAKQFEDVYADSVDTIWTPFGSPGPIVLNKGLGVVWYFRFSDGSYYLQGAIINGVKMGVITEVRSKEIVFPQEYSLKAYPNPFNSTTNIAIILPNSDVSELSIYNILGQKVASLFEEYKLAGNYNIKFNADHLSSGLYIIVLKQNNIMLNEKIILLK
jgi:hypothetical protein